MWGWTFQSLFPNPQPLGAGIGSRHLARLKSINPWQVNKCFWRWPTQKSGPETVYLRRAPFVRHVYQIAVGAERTLKSNQFWTEWRLLGDSSQRPSNILISEIYHFILFSVISVNKMRIENISSIAGCVCGTVLKFDVYHIIRTSFPRVFITLKQF